MPYKLGSRTIHYIGEEDCERLCKLKTTTGAPVVYQDIITQYGPDNLFEDPDFPPNDASIDMKHIKLDSAAKSSKYPDWDRSIHWMRPQKAAAAMSGDESKQAIFSTSSAKDSTAKSRFDVKQGKLGDCWFVASLSQVTLAPELLDLVVPADNENNNGSGAYHFRFYHFGEWVDVVVDDHVPMIELNGIGKGWRLFSVHLDTDRDVYELWPVLAEKAYAKINGAYSQIESGHSRYGLQDLSGGITDVLKLKDSAEDHPGFFEFLQKINPIAFANFGTSSKKNSKEGEALGIRPKHAYTLTKLAVVNYNGEDVQLVRLRNPWGHTEWTGPWSEDSEEWNSVPEERKQELGIVKEDDGEFWIPYERMMYFYDHVDFCYWFPENSDIAHLFNISQYHLKWSVADGTAGGYDEPWNNPQAIAAVKGSASDGKGLLLANITIKVGLKEKNIPEYILRVYQVSADRIGQEPPFAQEFFEDKQNVNILKLSDEAKEQFKYSEDNRDSYGWRVPVGNYVVVAVTKDAGVEAELLLSLSAQNVDH